MKPLATIFIIKLGCFLSRMFLQNFINLFLGIVNATLRILRNQLSRKLQWKSSDNLSCFRLSTNLAKFFNVYNEELIKL